MRPTPSKTPPSILGESPIETGWNKPGKVQLARMAVARHPSVRYCVLKRIIS